VAKIADWDDHIGRRLRLRDLRVFFAVVQAGSLSKAAAQLRVSHPAVSQVIADLEHALGVRLFDRSSRGIEPTIYARALLTRGRAAFDELKQGIRDIEFLADPRVGELTIGYAQSNANTIFPQIVERFSADHPRVVMRAHIVPTPSFTFPGLRDRTYDLILARLTKVPPDDDSMDDLNVEALFDDPLTIVASARTRWARRRKIDLAELLDEPWLMAPSDTPSYQVVAEAFKAQSLPMPTATLVTYSIDLRARLSARGQFITVVPKSVLRNTDELHTLKELPVNLPKRPWFVAILTLRNRTLSPLVQRFIECARQVTKPFAKTSAPQRSAGIEKVV
jgi:DNA-binding transcriptional LysR family regulator